MSPPPLTPSPHRFITPKPQHLARSSSSSSALVQASTTRSRTPQFNATPRFSFASSPRLSGSQTRSTSTPSTPKFAPSLRPPRNDVLIEDAVDGPEQHVSQTLECQGRTEEDGQLMLLLAEEEYDIGEPAAKRCRLSTSPVLPAEALDVTFSSPLPSLPSPPAKGRGISTAPRFLPATPGPASSPQIESTQGQSFVKPRRFRPPHPAAQHQTRTQPLPEQFSPHRRGQKYVPGGLAAEVRDWLFNIESTLSSSHRPKEDAWDLKLIIDEVRGGDRAGVTVVRGRQFYKEGPELDEAIDELGEVKMLLAGEGASTGVQKGPSIEVGCQVGIKGPIWEITLQGLRWGVGADWRVLH